VGDAMARLLPGSGSGSGEGASPEAMLHYFHRVLFDAEAASLLASLSVAQGDRILDYYAQRAPAALGRVVLVAPIRFSRTKALTLLERVVVRTRFNLVRGPRFSLKMS